LLSWCNGDVAMVQSDEGKEEGTFARIPAEVARVGRFWEQPHNLRASHGGFTLRSISQGKDQWQFSLSEDGAVDKPGVFASQECGKGRFYGLEYDSTKSSYSIADVAGLKLKRVAFSAATKASDSNNLDWTFQVQGDKGREFAATGDRDSVVYGGTFGVEVPVNKDVVLRYAFDTKRRAGASKLPSWFRHSAGVRIASPAGNVSMNIHQPNPDVQNASFEYHASLVGEIKDSRIGGSPTYTLRTVRDGDTLAAHEAKVALKGPKGFTGGLTAAVHGGKPAISAFGEYAAKQMVAKGVELGGDAKVVLSPPGQLGGNEVVELHPVGFMASADLGKLAPSVAHVGSTLDVRARYKLGAARPALSALAKLRSKKLAALEVEAEGSVDGLGKSSGKLKVSGAARGVAAQYETVASPGSKARHAAQVLWPAELKTGSARAYGRLMQSEADHGGKPRLQLGVQYDFNTDIAGRKVRVEGDSAVYDSGSTLLGENGLAWRDSRLSRARQTAAALRRRIEGPGLRGRRGPWG